MNLPAANTAGKKKRQNADGKESFPVTEELNEELQESGISPEENGGVRAGGWLTQLRYNRSFTAKLLLSEPEVKEYYAAVATELLSYEKVRSRTGWSGVTFTAGRTQIARCALSGKTLNLYLAVSASGVSGARYKARDVGATRKYEKTPALLRIRSAGGAKNAVRCIAQVAGENGLVRRSPLPEPISPKAFPADSLGNLITRGLVRIVRGRTTGEGNVPPVSADVRSIPAESASRPATDIYTDTRDSARELLSRYTTYGTIRDALTSGDASVRVTEKKMLRAIDEGWVTRVEDSLFALDELIRCPSRYIAETEEILPMELTKKISGRSVVHLSQHTDYIASVDGDEITPSKLLNVFREDSILTYENKFLNTLLSRLYLFVSRRYRTALREGVDERVDCLEFSDRFYHGDVRGKLHVSLEVSEKCADGKDVKNGLFGTGLWKRVERLNGIVTEYMESDFVREMGRNFVHPPILRTNAILKNKYFRDCLDLWNFLEGYDESGVGITVEETVKTPDDSYVGELFDNAAMQYLLFCRHTRGEYADDRAIAAYRTPLMTPRIRVEEEPGAYAASDFDTTETAAKDADDADLVLAVRVALRAAEFYDRDHDLPDGESAVEIRYEKDFNARIRLADDKIKEYFVTVSNSLLSLRGVKLRISRSYCTFYVGRTLLARLAVKGKTLYFYAALDPETLPPAYFARDAKEVRRYAATPALLRVRSDRWLKYALQLTEQLADRYELSADDPPKTVLRTEEFAILSFEELMEKGWIRRVEVLRSAGASRKETDAEGTEDGLPALSEDTAPAGNSVTAIAGESVTAGDEPLHDGQPESLGQTVESAGETQSARAETDSVDGESGDAQPAVPETTGVAATANTGTGDGSGAQIPVTQIPERRDDAVSPAPSPEVLTSVRVLTKEEEMAELARRSSGAAERKSAGTKDTDTAFYDSPGFPDHVSVSGTDSSRSADFFEAPVTVPGSDPRTDKAEERTAEEKEKNDRLLSDIRYPGAMDYSRPTGKGIDDSSGFIKDSEENVGDFEVPEKKSFFGRLFGKKKGQDRKK